MRKQLLAIALMGASLLTYDQSERKTAKDFKSPQLISVQEVPNQSAKTLLREKLQLQNAEDLYLIHS